MQSSQKCQILAIKQVSDPKFQVQDLSFRSPPSTRRRCGLQHPAEWDDELKNEDDALAVAEVRLSQDGGAHSIELIGRKGSGCKRVRVSFVVSMVEDAVS